jgi:hypothetical protein
MQDLVGAIAFIAPEHIGVSVICPHLMRTNTEAR